MGPQKKSRPENLHVIPPSHKNLDPVAAAGDAHAVDHGNSGGPKKIIRFQNHFEDAARNKHEIWPAIGRPWPPNDPFVATMLSNNSCLWEQILKGSSGTFSKSCLLEESCPIELGSYLYFV